MIISHDTCQATVDKMFTDHDGAIEHVLSMHDVMKDRGHGKLYKLLTQLIAIHVPVDDDASEDERMEVLMDRTLTLSLSLLAYSCTFAAHECGELNDQFA